MSSVLASQAKEEQKKGERNECLFQNTKHLVPHQMLPTLPVGCLNRRFLPIPWNGMGIRANDL